MGTVTYQPTDPEAQFYEQLRKDNAAQTESVKKGTAEPLPDRKPNDKPQE